MSSFKFSVISLVLGGIACLSAACSSDASSSCEEVALDTSDLSVAAACLLNPDACEQDSIHIYELTPNEIRYFFKLESCQNVNSLDEYDCLVNADVCDYSYFTFDTLSVAQKCLFFPKMCQQDDPDDSGSCKTSCTLDTYKCSGKSLMKCENVGDCNQWKLQTTCQSYCNADYAVCMETLPTCQIKPGIQATVVQWTDGDTVWIKANTDGTCNNYEYTQNKEGVYSWKPVRFDIRLHGIDAPECTKKQNSNYYYTCIQDSTYTNTNERMGYESWVKATELVPHGSIVTVSCEETEKDGTCTLDATDSRYLTYLGYTANNATYDFSTELVRNGMAFSNTKFSSKKRKAICDAQTEAQNAKVGLWSLASTPNAVFGLMGDTKQDWLYKMTNLCKKAK